MSSKVTLGEIYRSLKEEERVSLESDDRSVTNEIILQRMGKLKGKSSQKNTENYGDIKPREKSTNESESNGHCSSYDVNVKKVKKKKRPLNVPDTQAFCCGSDTLQGNVDKYVPCGTARKRNMKHSREKYSEGSSSLLAEKTEVAESGYEKCEPPEKLKKSLGQHAETSAPYKLADGSDETRQSVESSPMSSSCSDTQGCGTELVQNNDDPEKNVIVKMLKKKYKNSTVPARDAKLIKELEFSDYFMHIPIYGKPRGYTVSIAVPVTMITESCQSEELKTYIVGQLSRTLAIFCIDEVVLYIGGPSLTDRHRLEEVKCAGEHMHTILEYQECPQYLRKWLYGYSSHLCKVGTLNPLNTHHHLRKNEWCNYREGITLESKKKSHTEVNVGLQNRIYVPQHINPGTRVTVKIPSLAKETWKHELLGEVVSRDEPRMKEGLYFGYGIRDACSLHEVFEISSFNEKYDLIIGTSDKGTHSHSVKFPTFKHALIVFGDSEGLEAAFENDPQLKTNTPSKFFDVYVNTCPHQGSRTIRTEEAIPMTLATLQHKLARAGKSS